jgi:nitrate/nitrite transport system ATP-binding protein
MPPVSHAVVPAVNPWRLSVAPTHDVDEAVLLADRILLMTNGPQARVAEIVRNTMPRGRMRATLHHDPQYYRIRNHLVDFLVSRSADMAHGRAPAQPIEVSPGLEDEPTPPATTRPKQPTPLRRIA